MIELPLILRGVCIYNRKFTMGQFFVDATVMSVRGQDVMFWFLSCICSCQIYISFLKFKYMYICVCVCDFNFQGTS